MPECTAERPRVTVPAGCPWRVLHREQPSRIRRPPASPGRGHAGVPDHRDLAPLRPHRQWLWQIARFYGWEIFPLSGTPTARHTGASTTLAGTGLPGSGRTRPHPPIPTVPSGRVARRNPCAGAQQKTPALGLIQGGGCVDQGHCGALIPVEAPYCGLSTHSDPMQQATSPRGT